MAEGRPLRALGIAGALALLAGCGGGGGGGPGAVAADVEVTALAAGDIADCSAGTPQASAAARTAALITAREGVVLTLGDNAYPAGAPTQFADCYHPTWGAFRDRTHPSPGNHDYATAGADGYFGYFGSLAGRDRSGYYSFDVGSWHVVALNSNVDAGAGSAQLAWVKADLAAAASRTCTLAYWHHPLFSSGPHGNNAHMQAVYQALYDAGADVVLAGHDHLYERFAPQDAAGTADPARGIRSFVVGTGGAALYTVAQPRPNSEVRETATHGVLKLTLRNGGYDWEFLPAAGGTFRDRGSDVCHR